MKLIDIKDLTLPQKYDEEFRKVDFENLFNFDFKDTKNYEINIFGEKKIDSSAKKSILFDIVKNFDETQTVLKIVEDTTTPILIVHRLKEENTFFVNSLKIEVGVNKKATIIEVFVSESTNSAYSVNREFELSEKSRLDYAKIQDIKESNSLIFNASFTQRKESNLEVTNVDFGDGFVVNNYENELNHKNTTYNLNALVKVNKNANITNLINTIHNEENCLSNINYKHLLDGNSKAVFKAKSVVNHEAKFSKAFQNSNTVLLSDDALIYAQPHLEILIDELEASHGATTGTLDEDQLLYLQSRGIKKELAVNLLLKAYERQIYDNINNTLVKEFIEKYVKE